LDNYCQSYEGQLNDMFLTHIVVEPFFH